MTKANRGASSYSVRYAGEVHLFCGECQSKISVESPLSGGLYERAVNSARDPEQERLNTQAAKLIERANQIEAEVWKLRDQAERMKKGLPP